MRHLKFLAVSNYGCGVRLSSELAWSYELTIRTQLWPQKGVRVFQKLGTAWDHNLNRSSLNKVGHSRKSKQTQVALRVP